jgi:DUF1680 family protein
LRIPVWSEKTEVKKEDEIYRPESGKYFKVRIEKGKTGIELNFDIKGEFYRGNPNIESSRNCLAIKRGPIVYCLESIDNPDINLFNSLLLEQKIKEDYEEIFNGSITLSGEILTSSNELPLYEKSKKFKIDYEKKKFKAIPYFLWANRGKSKMNIWFLSS